MAWVSADANAYINRLVREQIYTKQVRTRPLFYFLSGRYPHNLEMLYKPYGRPDQRNDNFKFGVSLGGDYALATRMETLGSEGHEFRYQKDTPDDGSHVGPGGSTPTATKFMEDLVGTAETRWTKKFWPMRIRNSTLENARGKTRIARVAEEATKFGFINSFDNRHGNFWTDTLTEAEQNKSEWSDGVIGIDHWVSDGVDHSSDNSGPDESSYAFVGRVDRTATADGEDTLKANVLWTDKLIADGHMPTARPTLDLIRKACTINSLGGLRNFDGEAGDLVITTSEIWNALAEEAEDQHLTIYAGGEYKYPDSQILTFGYQGDVIKYGTSCITYDPQCPSGKMYILSTKSFMYEIAPGFNYGTQEWRDKGKTEEGGEDYVWSQIRLKDRLTCVMPWMNTKIVDLDAS